MKDTMLFTPRTKTGERLSMEVFTIDIPKGQKGKKFEVETVDDGQKYTCKIASCGLKGCFCDAVILDWEE